jgi:small GTP-binding protein
MIENENEDKKVIEEKVEKEQGDENENETENKNKEDDIKIEENISNFEKEYYKLKLIVIGDSGVGKTNIIKRYISNTFTIDTKSTVGVEFFTKTFKINEDILKLEIWDTAGQERYKAITSAYYRGSRGALIVYDISRIETYNNVDKWITELKEKVEGSFKLLLIGNKSDLKEERKMSIETAMHKARQLNVPLMETSAFDSTNIKKAFETILKEMYKDFKKEKYNYKREKTNKSSEGVNLEVENQKEKGCC